MKMLLPALILLSGCVAMSPEQLAASAKDKNAVVACGKANGPWGQVITTYIDTNKINDNNSVTVEGECKVTVVGSKQPKPEHQEPVK